MFLQLAGILLVSGMSLSNDGFGNEFFEEEDSSPRAMPDFWLFGDMELTDDQKSMLDVPTGADKNIFPPKAPAATREQTLLWEGGIIPYVFDCSLQNMPELKRIVRAAMDDWESKSCIRFVERKDEKEYLTLFRGTHCHSSVGRAKGEPRKLSVGDGCEYHHVMVHELGHVIGFWHEQSRPDRDDYVKIIWKNVNKGWEYAFLKLSWDAIDSMNTPYDYSSIMHYALNAFSRSPRRKTIVPLRKVRARPYRRISKIDALQVKRMYKCASDDNSNLAVKRFQRHVKTTITRGLVTIRGFTRSNEVEKKDTNCKDTSAACPFWAKKGFCETRRDFMLTDCQRSCNVCKTDNEDESNKLAKECKDERKACPQWAEAGYCERRPDFMHVKCKKTCRLCDDHRCMDRDPRCRAWARWKYCTHKDYKKMMEQVCRMSCAYCVVVSHDCKDREKVRCPRLKKEGYCESEDPDRRLAMRNMCARTCGFCQRIEVDDSKPVATPPCQDTFKACFGWSRLGYCLSRERYMGEYCKKSCNLCSSKDPAYISEKCLDNDIACAEWKSMGYCELESKKTYMAFNCKRTCRLCRRKQALAPPPCVDQSKICPIWARRGDCHSKALYMMKNCQQSCNICHSTPWFELAVPPHDTPCIDKHKQCSHWAEEGFCDIYSNYMYKKCRLSCEACYPDQDNEFSVTCENKVDNANCEHWAGLDKCKNRADFMIDNCQHACNSCPTKPIKLRPEIPTGIKCKKACKYWLEEGYCSSRWRRRCIRTCLALGCDDEPVRPEGSCFEPLGVGWNFTLPDSAFNASSSHYRGKWNFGPHNARLYKEDDRYKKQVGGWCADGKGTEQWLQVDLGKIKFVTAVATQGRDKFFEHVKSYELSFSKDGTRWHPYKEKGRIRVLQGNCDHFTPVVNRLNRRILARFVRFYPRTYTNICMRVEIYGCNRHKGYEKKKAPPPILN